MFLDLTSSSELKVESVLKIIRFTSITIIFNIVIDICIVRGREMVSMSPCVLDERNPINNINDINVLCMSHIPELK